MNKVKASPPALTADELRTRLAAMKIKEQNIVLSRMILEELLRRQETH